MRRPRFKRKEIKMANERLSFRAFLKDAVFYNEDGNEYTKSFYLYDVALYKDLDCGIGRDDLEAQLREQGFSEKEIRRIEEDEFDSWEAEWYFFTPSAIEQCTGMKDDDGKLIYEGDLVDLVGYGVCKVDWVEDTAEFMFQNLGEDLREHVETMMLYEWKVVGNIHENAELLK